jgi:hypothetical protein
MKNYPRPPGERGCVVLVVNKKLKCIKDHCKYYFESDGIERCGLTQLYIHREHICVGFEFITPKQEEIGCKIAQLTADWDYLENLKSEIAHG